MSEALNAWFKREILVHEEALVNFIRRRWRSNPDEVYDLRQETYTRVLEAASTALPTSAKSFLFTTAKHLITDRIRRQRVITIDTIGDLEALNVAIDDLSPERLTSARQELRLLARALDSLPPKCRETVWLRRVENLSQKEIANRLSIAQKTVEGHLTKGLRRLADVIFGNERSTPDESASTAEHHEHSHGKP